MFKVSEIKPHDVHLHVTIKYFFSDFEHVTGKEIKSKHFRNISEDVLYKKKKFGKNFFSFFFLFCKKTFMPKTALCKYRKQPFFEIAVLRSSSFSLSSLF